MIYRGEARTSIVQFEREILKFLKIWFKMVDFDDFGGDRAVDLPIRRLDRAKTAIRGAFLEVFVQFWVMLKNILPDLLSPEGRAW